MLAFGILLPLAAGWLIAGRLLPNQGRIIRAAVAFGLAVGVTSVEFFFTLLIVGKSSRIVSLAAAVLMLIVSWRFRAKRSTTTAVISKRSIWLWPTGAFAVWMVLSAGIELLMGLASAPHGEYDGVAIWNTRARGLYRGGPNWRDAFHPSRYHTDYPLLLPTTVARLWTWQGFETPLAGGLFGVACLAGIVALVGAGVSRLRGPELGCLAVGFLLANPWFVGHAYWQYADIPLSLYITGAVVVWVLGRNGPGGFGPPTVVGLFLGFGAWTKNEGLAFAGVFLVLAIVEAIRHRNRRQDWLALAAGFAIAFAAIVAFKLAVRAENDLVEGQNRDTIAKLTDPGRWQAVMSYAWSYFIDQPWYHLLVLPAAILGLGFGRLPKGMGVPTLAVTGTASIYLFVYITTPHNLDWHLATSFDRLVTHLMPAVYFLSFAMLLPIGQASFATKAIASNR